MILINVKFRVKPEHTATFLTDIDWFTTATRAEPGNLFLTGTNHPPTRENSSSSRASTMTPPNPT